MTISRLLDTTPSDHRVTLFSLVQKMTLRLHSKPDRRRRQRQLLNTSVCVFSGPRHLDALGINLSDTGMCLFAIANLPVGAQIEIDFLPQRCNERIRISGTVRHRALYLNGIEFLEDSDQTRTAEQPVDHCWFPFVNLSVLSG